SSTRTSPSPPNSVDFHWPRVLPLKRGTSLALAGNRAAGAVGAAGRVAAGRVVGDFAAGRGGSELDSQAIRVVTSAMMTRDWRNMVLLMGLFGVSGGLESVSKRLRGSGRNDNALRVSYTRRA